MHAVKSLADASHMQPYLILIKIMSVKAGGRQPAVPAADGLLQGLVTGPQSHVREPMSDSLSEFHHVAAYAQRGCLQSMQC